MPDSQNPKMPETALATRTVEEEARLLEKQRLQTARQELVRTERQADLAVLISRIDTDAARIVSLRRHMFKTDEELDAIVPKLSYRQRKIIRQFEEPKKLTAFGVESAAKHIEAKARAQADRAAVKINVENAVIQLPEKREESVPPVYIDVHPEGEK